MHAQQDAPPALAAEAVANPPGLPAIGRWMIAPDGTIAHWLGQIVGGKRLHEPVNCDPDRRRRGGSADDARRRLPRGYGGGRLSGAFRAFDLAIAVSSAACSTASSHRGATTPSPTTSSRKPTTTAACSDRTRFDSGYLFIGAFQPRARQSPALARPPLHVIQSGARRFARGLEAYTAFKAASSVTAWQRRHRRRDGLRPAITDGRAVALRVVK